VIRNCSRCGKRGEGPDDGMPEGWSMVTEKGRVEFQCAECVRTNIRAIEGKLSEEWWEG
jgi:hypothetical protein